MSNEEREQVELVQLAAVAVASRESFRYGQAGFEDWVESSADEGPTMQGFEVLDDIANERMAQDAKWGNQSHGRLIWAMILAEEIGEWAEELGAAQPGDGIEPYEATQIRAALGYLRTAGVAARAFLENHEWPDRQQEVFDAELQDREATEGERVDLVDDLVVSVPDGEGWKPDREATAGEAARDAVLGAGGSREEADDAALAVDQDSSEVVPGAE